MLYISIGYLFVFFHVKINGFDFLPSLLGYVLIVIGLTKLSDKSDKFAKAKPWAIGMACFSFLVSAGELFGMSCNGIVSNILYFLTVLIMLYIFYLIVMGVHDLECIENVQFGFSDLMLVWKIQAVLRIVVVLFSYISSDATALMLSVFTILAIMVNIIFLVLFYRSKTLYAHIN